MQKLGGNRERSYLSGRNKMYCYHQYNYHSLCMTHSTAGDRRSESMKLDTSGRQILGRQKSCHRRSMQSYIRTYCRRRKREPTTALDTHLGAPQCLPPRHHAFPGILPSCTQNETRAPLSSEHSVIDASLEMKVVYTSEVKTSIDQ